MRSAKSKTRRHVQKKASRTRRTSPKTTAIVQVATAPLAPLEPRYQGRVLPRDKVDLLKRTVCKEGDDNQFALFLHQCESSGLDPFRKQIYAIFFNNDESRQGKGQKDMVMITGIDGFSMMAARDHKDFGGVSSAKFTWFDPNQKTPKGRRIPEEATVTAYRKGGEPVEITVYWEEYAPTDLTTKKSEFWNKMPKNQLEKCAQAKAYRRNFPGQGNIFVIQEMAQKLSDITPGGRDIVDKDGFTPSGTPLTYAAQSQSKIANEVDRQKSESTKTTGFAGEITIDYTRGGEGSPAILCSDADVLEIIKSKCKLQWGTDSFWHLTTGRDLGTIEEIGIKHNFQRVEIMPNKPIPPKDSGSSQRRPESKSTAKSGKKDDGASGRVAPAISSRARLIQPVRIQVCDTKTSANKKNPYMTMLVKIGTRAEWMDTWDHNFFMWFSKAKKCSVECGIYISDSSNPRYNKQIVGIEYIGDIKFRDKKYPIKPEKKTDAQEGFEFQ